LGKNGAALFYKSSMKRKYKMTQQIGPFYVDIWMNIFPHLPITEYPALTQVSKLLNEFLTEKFWKPAFGIQFPTNVQQQKSEEIPYNMRVAVLFQKNEEEIDFIVDQIKDDAELAQCLHTNEWKLEIFKELSPFDRSRLMWKAMFHDATPILVKLVSDSYVRNVVRQDGFYVEVSPQFGNTDRFLPIVKSLIEQHKVPYDKVDFICALLPGFYLSSIEEQLIFSIIESGEDLSNLKGKTFQDPDEGHHLWAYTRVTDIYIKFTKWEDSEWQTKAENLVRCKLWSVDDRGNYYLT
jgi:hypothetical protein